MARPIRVEFEGAVYQGQIMTEHLGEVGDLISDDCEE